MVDRTGKSNDVARISGAALEDCLLVDDFEGYVLGGQREHWARAACCLAPPYVLSDCDLQNTVHELGHRINLSRIATLAGDA